MTTTRKDIRLAEELESARAALRQERIENRRRNALFSRAIRSNDLREVGEDLYRYFYKYFGVSRGDITILKDYDERDFYDRVGWTPRTQSMPLSWYYAQAKRCRDYLKSLVEEEIFIGYRPEEERSIRNSLFIEQSMLECMVAKRSRIVNNVSEELSAREVEAARRQKTSSWLNWPVLHPENSKLLVKLHMSFSRPRQPALKELTRRLQPFDDLLRYRILHTRDFKRVKYLSERDVLTGLYLRPVLAKRWERFLSGSGARARRHAQGRGTRQRFGGARPVISLCMLDLDFFKRFNDRYGHDVGDAVLKSFSQALLSTLRGSDIVGRYGGEEFAALFPGASSETVRSILDRVHELIKDKNFLPPVARNRAQGPEHLCLSAGIFTMEVRPGAARPSFDDAIKAADDLLLHCKRSGRNRCAYLDKSGAIQEFSFDA